MDISASFNADPFLLLAVLGLLGISALLLALAAIVQQRRSQVRLRVQFSEFQERLGRLEAAADGRFMQSLNKPRPRRRASRTESPRPDSEAVPRIVEAPRIGGDTEP